MRALSILFLLVSVGGCSLAIDNAIDGRARDGGADADADTDANDGAVDPCADEACECTSNAACGPHARCVPETHECECVPSYVGTGLGDCTFESQLANSDFTSAGGWTLTGAATIETTQMGQSAMGVAKLECTPARIEQTFEMPRREDSEPLVVELTARGEGFGGASYADIFLAWNDRVLPVETIDDNTWTTRRICVGAAGFGGTVTLAVQSSGTECDPNHNVLDSVRLVPANAGECPTETILNPGFENADAWQPSFVSSGSSGTAVMVAGVGQGGTRGARVGTTGAGSSGSFEQAFSWPLEPGRAISYWQENNAGSRIRWLVEPIDRFDAAADFGSTLASSSGARLVRVCAPPWLRGLSMPFTFRLGYDPACGAGCQAALDDFSIVDEPACADPYISDGSFTWFQRAEYASSWGPGSNPNSGGAGVDNGGMGRTGLGARFHADSLCDMASLRTWVRVPNSSGANGPSLTFWARRGNGSNARMRMWDASADVELSGTSWTENTVCLAPRLQGRPAPIEFVLYGTTGSCGADTTYPQESIYIDDVSLGTDPSCPATPP